ncbi:MAG: hypothetical protein HYS74_02775 [Parcubacteria group bacterium]|nr:hypothetical protein [Parcubacteria group bacterium]
MPIKALACGLAAVTFWTISPAVATAQAEAVSIILRPPTPEPFTEVTAEARSFAIDLNQTEIVWTLNGEVLLRGVAEKTITLRTGKAGTPFALMATAQGADGVRATGEKTFFVSSVDLLWEAPGVIVPALFPGKALAAAGSIVRVAALPEIFSGNQKIPARNLLFFWSIDGERFGAYSGKGKNILPVKMSGGAGATHRVQVSVSLPDNTPVAERSTTIRVAAPEVLFYEEHPLLGALYQNAISSKTLFRGQDIDVRAAPYFFTTPAKNIVFSWKANGADIAAGQDSSILSFRPAADIAGLFDRSLIAQNIADASEQAEAHLRFTIQQ